MGEGNGRKNRAPSRVAETVTEGQKIERSIITTYRKGIWSRFVKGVKEYALVEEGDKIAVCISGGKDSMLLAKCMQELQRHSDVRFDLHFLTMDPGMRPKTARSSRATPPF